MAARKPFASGALLKLVVAFIESYLDQIELSPSSRADELQIRFLKSAFQLF